MNHRDNHYENRMIRRVFPAVLLAVCVAPRAFLKSQSAHEISERYVDIINGYSIIPPGDGINIKKESSDLLAHWGKNSEKTGKTIWSLKIATRDYRDKKTRIGEYTKQITDFVLSSGGEVSASNEISIAGKPAFMVAGTLTTRSKNIQSGQEVTAVLLFREAWILVDPGTFLVITLTTSNSMDTAARERTWHSTIDSVAIIDNSTALAERQRSMATGRAFLWGDKNKNVTPGMSIERIRAALPSKPRWFFIFNGAEKTGWICKHGGSARSEGKAGYRARIWSMQKVLNGPDKVIRISAFITPEFDREKWRKTIQIGSGEQSRLVDENGMRIKGLIVRTITQNQLNRITRNNRIPKKIQAIYLPKIASLLLPNLIGASGAIAGEWTFAEYSVIKNEFSMRTLKIDRTEKIRLHSGQSAEAARMIGREGTASRATVYWVDGTGRLLKTLNPGGVTTELTSEDAVMKQFPAAPALIARMNTIFDKIGRAD